jgi:hypothetical protein
MAVAHTWDLAVLRPGRFEPDVIGTKILGGQANPSGVAHATGYKFGGLVSIAYRDVFVHTAAQHRYWSLLARRLAGGLRDIAVPVLTDRVEPAGLAATLDGAHAAAATSLSISVSAGEALTPGHWFGIAHADAGQRVYAIASIDSTADLGGGAVDYGITISPPLRDAAADAAALDFSRPACLMTLAPGESMALPVGAAWESRPSVGFIEAEW